MAERDRAFGERPVGVGVWQHGQLPARLARRPGPRGTWSPCSRTLDPWEGREHTHFGFSEGQGPGLRPVGGREPRGPSNRFLRLCPLVQVSQPWECQPRGGGARGTGDPGGGGWLGHLAAH